MTNEILFFDSQIKMPLIKVDLRSTALKLKDGSYALVSPIKFTENQKTQIKKHGKVSAIIAPNLFHHLYVGHAKESFPEAKVICSPGLPAKRPDLKIDHIITNNVPHDLLKGSISQTLVSGMPKVNEVVFCHHLTRTLVVTDMIFNIMEYSGKVDTFLWKLNGAYKKPAVSRFYRFNVRDKRLLRQSVEHILGWDFDRIVMSHGKIIETNGRTILREAFAWLLKR